MKKIWWKEEVIYQIYPRSFNDSNGDGIGDIPGIIEKLDYLKNLGVDIIWLSPIYDSPNDDNGYDISNYYKIHPEFGTMAEFDEMLKGLHDRGMKLIMDLVVNHSSDEHEWFEASRQSKNNAHRDYYIWKKGKDGGPPNNWKSFFGGSAWEYDKKTDEYYLHIFSKKQPDLNWENPNVRKEVYKNIRFWLDKGVDGFRMDVIPLISKRLEFADANFESFGECVEKMYSNGPRVHEFINEMYEAVLKEYDIMTVGEGPGITSKVGLNYVHESRGELSMIFHLDHMFLGFGSRGRFDVVSYDLKDVKRIFREWYDAMGDSGWVSIFLDNHDFARMVSRWGNDTTYRIESAKMLAMLVLTMRGTPSIYQGSEIGMTNVKFDSIDDFDDLEALNFYKEFSEEGMSEKEFIEIANTTGRDNVRTPIQWDNNKHAGFTTGEPWIKVNPNYPSINAKIVLENPDSIYYFYKKMLAFRKENLTLVYGKYEEIKTDNEQLFIYRRWDEAFEYYVVLNFSDKSSGFHLENISSYECVIGNYLNNENTNLQPWEGRLYRKLI
ncbi:MAG: alpha-glucosidase [Saprospiraceae bacterium]